MQEGIVSLDGHVSAPNGPSAPGTVMEVFKFESLRGAVEAKVLYAKYRLLLHLA